MLKVWQRREKDQQKTILILIGVATICLGSGFLIGSIAASSGEKIELEQANGIKQNEIFQTGYSKINNVPPKEAFWLGPKAEYNAYANQNRVIYIKKGVSLSPSAVARAMTIITEKKGDGSLFRSFQPMKKIGQNRYLNSSRQVFVWLPPGNYLAYSANIKSDPGEVE